MALFYFDVKSNGALSRDEDGQHLNSVKMARREAVWAVVEMMRNPPSGNEASIIVTVRDETDRLVVETSLTFRLHPAQ